MKQNTFEFNINFRLFGYGLTIHNNKEQCDLNVYPLLYIGLHIPNKSIELGTKIYKW